MGKKINDKATKLKNKKVSAKNREINTQLNEPNYDKRKGRLAFSYVCHKKCSISDWAGQELTQLIDTFKKFESLNWEEIFKDSGLNWERNRNIALKTPDYMAEDAKLHSIRVSKKMRIYGYRAQQYFYIIWFDKNHEVCPVHKRKMHLA